MAACQGPGVQQDCIGDGSNHEVSGSGWTPLYMNRFMSHGRNWLVRLFAPATTPLTAVDLLSAACKEASSKAAWVACVQVLACYSLAACQTLA